MVIQLWELEGILKKHADQLDKAHALGRREGMEEAADIADAHKGGAAKKRLEHGQRLSTIFPEEARAAIEDEERGEDIAADIIARTIRAAIEKEGG